VVAVVPAFLFLFYFFAGRIVPNASTGVPQVVYPNVGVALNFETAGDGVLVCIRREAPDILLPGGGREVHDG
jgi:hypothetical protein